MTGDYCNWSEAWSHSNAKTVLQAWFAYRKLSGLTMEQPAGPSPCAHQGSLHEKRRACLYSSKF